MKDVFRMNKELNEKEIKEGRIVLESKPTILMIMLSANCNLRCIMCPRPDSDYALPYEAFEKIDSLFPYLELINWGGGGEVFMTEYFKELFARACSHPQIRHDITTNGLLIDEEWAELLVRNNVHLSYSIDSARKETYEYIRRGARFEDLLESVEIIGRHKRKQRSKIRLILSAVVMRCNYKELELFPEFCKKHDFEQLRFEYLRPVIDPNQDIFTVRRDREAIEHLRNIMPRIERECGKLGIKLESHIKSFLNPDSTGSDRLLFNCRLPWKKLLIDGSAKGQITPDCLCMHPLGNIFDNTIEEVWNNETMQLYRKNILNKSTKNWCSPACSIYERH